MSYPTEKEQAMIAGLWAPDAQMQGRSAPSLRNDPPTIEDAEILAGWRARMDTLAIATKYFMPEHVIYNRLLHLRS